jgi:hypothetical protein
MPNFFDLHDAVLPTWSAADYGYKAWSFDPSQATGAYALTPAGTLQVIGLKVLGGTLSTITYQVTNAGSALTASQCFVGLYQNGTLLASSADQSGVWNSTGLKATALASTVTVTQGLVYVAFVFNGTTGPSLSAGSTTSGNFGLATASARYGVANTGVTTALPASLITFSAGLAATPLVAVS